MIENILKSTGPLISSELAKIISNQFNIPYNTASQRVAREKNILKIKGFFTSNQSLCYLSSHINDEVLFKAILNSMLNHGKKYWNTINAIKLHGGIISSQYLECYTNYPILPLKGHIPFNKVMQKFVKEGILIFNDENYLFSPKLVKISINSTAYRTIEAIKEDILDNFSSLIKNTGLASYNSIQRFGEYGKLRWALKGTTYITGLLENNKPGFLLCDILIGTKIYEKDVDFFIEKIKNVQSFKNASRLIPFLLVDDLHPDSLLMLKKHGIVVGFIKELFGEKYAETLKELIVILNNAGASLKKTPEKYLELISELQKYNQGLVNNIRGTLFEYMVGHIHSLNCQSIELGREITNNNSRHEMDVLGIYSDKIIIAECKATKAMIDYKAIDKWYENKIPAFKMWLNKQEVWVKKDFCFEFWSTGGFTEKAIEKLNFYSSLKNTEISYYGPLEMKELAINMKNKKLKEALDSYFLKSKV